MRAKVSNFKAGLSDRAGKGYGYLYRGWKRTTLLVSKFATVLRPFATACAIAFAVLAVANSAQLPKESWWDQGQILPWVFIGTGILTAVRQTVIYVDRRRRKRTTALNEACRKIAAHLDATCPGLALRHVGVHVWRVVGPRFAQHLEREAKFLIRDRRDSSVPWTRGKGVFGLAWEEESPVIVDLETRLYPLATSEAEFSALSDEDRLGTTEFILFCRRGRLATEAKIDSTWFGWPRRFPHSTKPDAFLDLVERSILGRGPADEALQDHLCCPPL